MTKSLILDLHNDLINGKKTIKDIVDNVKKIHDTAKKSLKAAGKWDGFHKDVLAALEDQAEANQIEKEFKEKIMQNKIENVGKIAISESYEAIPREIKVVNAIPTIVSDKKERYKDKPWTTRLKINNNPTNVYNFYPLYDWRTEDIWGCVAKYDWQYNMIYEKMYKNNVGIHQQRLCQFFGDDQRGSLDQIRVLEPETWEKALQRMAGVNFGNIYARTSLLGNINSEKPEHMTWQEYSVFLLESLGLYAPELRDHYYRKIRKFLDWYDKTENIRVCDVPDFADKKLESSKKVPSWRRVARAIERNDFWMGRLGFGETKSDKKLLVEMRLKYKSNLIKEENTNSKPLKRVAKELNL